MKLRIVLSLVPFLFLSGCNGLAGLAENLLYANEQVNKKYPVPEVPPEGYEEVSFKYQGEDGSPVDTRAWVYAQPNKYATTIVYSHGNAENLQTLWLSNFLNVVASLGVNIVAVDFPSYGRSTGAMNEYNFVTGVVKATEYAKQRFPYGKLIMWGRSMGASVAFLAAAKTQALLNGIVLTSPWSSFIDLAKDRTGLARSLPKDWVAKHGYNSVAVAPEITLPVLIHHGVKDKVIPIKFGRKLASSFNASTPVYMREFPDKEHNDIFQERQLWQDVYDFVQ